MYFDKLRNCVTAPDVLPLSLLTPLPRKGVGDKTYKRPRLQRFETIQAHTYPYPKYLSDC